MKKLALTNSHGMQGHNLKHTCVSRGADRCMPGLTNTTQEPHFPALPAELEFGDTQIVCNYRKAKQALWKQQQQQNKPGILKSKISSGNSKTEFHLLRSQFSPQRSNPRWQTARNFFIWYNLNITINFCYDMVKEIYSGEYIWSQLSTGKFFFFFLIAKLLLSCNP